MKISLSWLKTFFEKDLPSLEELKQGLTMHSFEIEEIIEIAGEQVLDIKVLPNRAHDAMSYQGIAREVSTIFNIELTKDLFSITPKKFPPSEIFSAKIETKNVKRFKALLINNVKVGESPEWLRERIESMGGRSINNIVDITNFVMFETGQPMHAFDRDKLLGQEKFSFLVREAKEGESVVTLDGVERKLNEGAILITDGESEGKTILGIAGIKGGKQAEITENTKNIILEAATFDAPVIRKHAKNLNIRTDASIRFENGIAAELPSYAIEEALQLIGKEASGKDFSVAGEFDYYPRVRGVYKSGVSLNEINSIIGANFSKSEVENILKRLGWSFEYIDNPIEKVIEVSLSQIDKPYKLGSSVIYDSPNCFDCASLSTFAYANAGFSIPRISIDQFVFGTEVSEKNIQIGDLVFANTGEGKVRFESIEFMRGTKVERGVDHVGIYIGNGEIVHATSKFGKVVREKLENSELFQKITGIRRIAENSDGRFIISVPFQRLDLMAHTEFNIAGIKEDLIEEIGRIYGLENIKSRFPTVDKNQEVNKEFEMITKVRQALLRNGYSEVYTYAMNSDGEVEIENPIASDKSTLRKNISYGLTNSLEFNSRNAPLFGSKEIKIFEIGSVFKKNNESTRVAWGIINSGKIKIEEVDLSEAFFKLVKDKSDERVETKEPEIRDVKFKQFSVFPFVLRDIAIWVPSLTDEKELVSIIKIRGGENLLRVDKFDEFVKNDQKSLAFHLVFQSMDRTLSDEEINSIMSEIGKELEMRNFKVR